MSVPHDAKTTGERIKHARHAAGMSQPQLAHAIEQAARRKSAVTKRRVTVPARDTLKTQISFWENDHREPGEFYRPLLADALGVAEFQLFGLPSTPAAPALDEATDELRSRVLAADAVDAGTIALLDAQTHHLRLMDRRLGGRGVLGQLGNHVDTVRGLLTHAVLPGQRAPLAAVLADAATLAGWQALDTGAAAQSWQHYETAKTAAREAESPALLAHAMGGQSYALLELGRTNDALSLVRAARAAAGPVLPPLLACWLAAVEAELISATNDPEGCRRALDLAGQTLPADYTSPELPYLMLAPAHLTRWRGSALARLGDTTALEHLHASLAELGTHSTLRAEAGLRCDLVVALTAAGERDQAAAEYVVAREVVARLGSIRLRRRLDHVAA